MGNKGKPSYLSALVKLYILHWSHLGCKLWKGEKNQNNSYCGPRLKRARRRARIGSLALKDFWVISSRSVQWGGSWLRLGVEYSPCLCSSVKVCSNSLSMWSLEVRRAKPVLDLLREASPPPQRNKQKNNTATQTAWRHECTHTPDDVLVSPLVGPTLVTGCRQRDDLLLPHQLQLLIERVGILLLCRQQQLAESHAPGVGLTVCGKKRGHATPFNFTCLKQR